MTTTLEPATETPTLPPSILTKNQRKEWSKQITYDGKKAFIKATVRYDDECGYGHNSFSITGEIRYPGARDCEVCGCINEEVAKHFPGLAPLIKWHLCSSDGPMHYIANTLYFAGDRDFNGLRKGEFRQFKNKAGEFLWKMKGVPSREMYSATKPQSVLVQPIDWEPDARTGDGKARELDTARSSAIWPEATDEELSAEPEELKRKLLERLPGLMAEFKAAVESLGFVY